MPRWKEPPSGFSCPYKDHCPYLEGLSTFWVFREYQRGSICVHEHWRTREEMSDEISDLLKTVAEQAKQIDRLQAENKRLHQQKFKPRNKGSVKSANEPGIGAASGARQRGAPTGHPPWTRKVPDRIDRTVEVDAPDHCPHCESETDASNCDATSFIQEDIVLRPQTVVTRYTYTKAWCPTCRRAVTRKPENELPFAPIGPQAKAAALYLRHHLKLPYRKIQDLMSTLFGLDFVPASTLGFEHRARKNADPLYEDLILKMRSSDLVHADETYWREDGENKIVWYAGNEDVAVFHIDAHRSSEAAKVLLGDDGVQGLFVTDGYAAYNVINALGRQSCLAHLLRKAHELKLEQEGMKNPDPASIRFCSALAQLFKYACKKTMPSRKKERAALKAHLLRALDLVCEKPLVFPKAETLRKRLIPGAREYEQLFSFIEFQGPPTNNHAERALRPLVIFRKVCMGTRSQKGSKNISVFTSLSQTATLQNSPILDLFLALLTGTSSSAQNALFNNSS